MQQLQRKLSCIVCPLSCEGEVSVENGEVKDITGFTCERGKKYAREELKAPKRMLTTTIKITGGELPLLPVVSKTSLPKAKIADCAKHLSCIVIQAPVKEGDIICKNILGLGVDIVASRDLSA